MLGASKNFQGKRIDKNNNNKMSILLVPKGRWLCALHVKKKCFCPWKCFQNVNIGMWLLFREMQTIQIDRNQIAGFSANYFSKTSLKVSLFLTFYSAFEYYVSIMLACWSVSLYHFELPVSSRITQDPRWLYTGNEKWYKPTDQYANEMFLLLNTFSITFLKV